MPRQDEIELVTVRDLDEFQAHGSHLDTSLLVRTIRGMFPLIEILADDHSPAGRSARNILRMMQAEGWTEDQGE